jgi:hypothetical protein
MLSWAKDNLGMSDELDALENIFNNQYSYGTEKWQIPSTSSQADLAVKTAAFVKEHQDPDSLLVIYYARHGTIGENRRSIWSWCVSLALVILYMCSETDPVPLAGEVPGTLP